jgi:hypothetical protein
MRGVPLPPLRLSGMTASDARAWRPSSHERARHRGRYGGHRTRPVTGVTGRGSSARRRASARRARRKLPPAYGAPPGPDPGRLRRRTFAFISPRDEPRPFLMLHIQAVRPGAPKVRP